MSEKCFCHLKDKHGNRYAVKDATARQQIEQNKKSIETNNASVASMSRELYVMTEEVEQIKANYNSLLALIKSGDINTGGGSSDVVIPEIVAPVLSDNLLLTAQVDTVGDNTTLNGTGYLDYHKRNKYTYVIEPSPTEYVGTFTRPTRVTGLIPISFVKGEKLIITGISKDFKNAVSNTHCRAYLFDENKVCTGCYSFESSAGSRVFNASVVGDSVVLTPTSYLYNGYYNYTYISFTFFLEEDDGELIITRSSNYSTYDNYMSASAIYDLVEAGQRQNVNATYHSDGDYVKLMFVPTSTGVITGSFIECGNALNMSDTGNYIRIRYYVPKGDADSVKLTMKWRPVDNAVEYSPYVKLIADGVWREVTFKIDNDDFIADASGNYSMSKFRLYAENTTIFIKDISFTTI